MAIIGILIAVVCLYGSLYTATSAVKITAVLDKKSLLLKAGAIAATPATTKAEDRDEEVEERGNAQRVMTVKKERHARRHKKLAAAYEVLRDDHQQEIYRQSIFPLKLKGLGLLQIPSKDTTPISQFNQQSSAARR